MFVKNGVHQGDFGGAASRLCLCGTELSNSKESMYQWTDKQSKGQRQPGRSLNDSLWLWTCIHIWSCGFKNACNRITKPQHIHWCSTKDNGVFLQQCAKKVLSHSSFCYMLMGKREGKLELMTSKVSTWDDNLYSSTQPELALAAFLSFL